MFGHPKGLFLVAFTEFWERYSYYGMVGLLVLFLTAPIGAGGFGWDRVGAMKLFGIYTGLAFAAPAVGGWLANSWLGERRAILSGGILLALGHFLLSGPAVVPWMIGRGAGIDVHDLLVESGVALGLLFPDEATLQAITSAAGPHAGAVIQSYQLSAWSFAAGLVLIIIGTALIKPTISSIVGKLYDRDSSKRETGFAIFMTAIYIGSILATFTAGTLGELVGWHFGFAAAGFGMLIGISFYAAFQKPLLGDVGRIPDSAGRPDEVRSPLTPAERDRLRVIFILGLFTVLYAVAFYQKGGLLSLVIREADRRMFGAEVPTIWFQAISTGTFIILAAPIARMFTRYDPAGEQVDAVKKLCAALLCLAAGYATFLIAFAVTNEGERLPAIWFALGFVLFGLGDVLLWPVQIALASRLAPQRFGALVIGCWYLTIGVGGLLTGYVGGLSEPLGERNVFILILVACTGSAAVLALLRPALVRRMHLQNSAGASQVSY
jgi:POT family proton-dependent oligopeptide transporter